MGSTGDTIPGAGVIAMSDKGAVRKLASVRRQRQAEKDRLSQRITGCLLAMPQYEAAATTLWYIDIRDEVRTRHVLPTVLSQGKRVAIPYCVGKDLRLFHLRSLQDLLPGAFGILEPRDELRSDADRIIDPGEVDWVAVPGVAFDIGGSRLGHGHGYYDRLLASVSPNAVLVGVAFQCQIVPSVPTTAHDISMDWIVTENGKIRCDDVANEGAPGPR